MAEHPSTGELWDQLEEQLWHENLSLDDLPESETLLFQALAELGFDRVLDRAKLRRTIVEQRAARQSPGRPEADGGEQPGASRRSGEQRRQRSASRRRRGGGGGSGPTSGGQAPERAGGGAGRRAPPPPPLRSSSPASVRRDSPPSMRPRPRRRAAAPPPPLRSRSPDPRGRGAARSQPPPLRSPARPPSRQRSPTAGRAGSRVPLRLSTARHSPPPVASRSRSRAEGDARPARSPAGAINARMPHNFAAYQSAGEMVQAEILERPSKGTGDMLWQASITMPCGLTNHAGSARVVSIKGPPRKARSQAEADAEQLTLASVDGPKAVRSVANQMHHI